MNVTKQEILDALVKSEKHAAGKLLDELRGIIYCIQATWKLTDDELCELLDRDKEFVDSLLHEQNDFIYNNISVDYSFLARVAVLSLGVYDVPGINYKEEDKQVTTNLLHEYTKLVHEPEKSKQEMIDDIFKSLGIENDDDLKHIHYKVTHYKLPDNIKEIEEIEDNYQTHHTEEEKSETKCECAKAEPKQTCNAYVYDGEKGKEYTFDVDPEAIQKFVSNIFHKILK